MNSSIRIPEFSPNDPKLWFCVLEKNFPIAGIVTDDAKVGYVTGALGLRYIGEVRDVILNPAPTGPLFETLKKEVIRRLCILEEQKVQKLLEQEEMGDRKPSQFFRHLRSLAGTCTTESLLRTLWSGRLPANVQAILATQKDTALDKVADLADVITNTMPGNRTIAETTQPLPYPSQQPVDALSDRMVQILIALQERTRALRAEVAELRLAQEDRPARRYNEHRPRRTAR
ncbi:uncharacterized protein LOC143356359 [Halictus rubicundus]|uniref:uncharacterized protein LOC143356359 n=1 Tax=Halictus rubicundus TaxID=77578 RepID=UPI004035BDB3